MLLFLAFLSFSFSTDCLVTKPQQHYLEFHMMKGEFKFIAIEEDLNGDGLKDLVITARDTCGTSGCDYFVYQKKKKNCYQPLGSIFNHIYVSEEVKNGYKTIRTKTQKRQSTVKQKKI